MVRAEVAGAGFINFTLASDAKAAVVREVGGPRVAVQSLMGAGVDPHLYKPTRGDVASLLAADMVFYSGLLLEGRMGDVLAKVGRSGKPVVAVTEALDHASLLSFPERPGHFDPHVWMDVKGWMDAVKVVVRSLGEVDADNAAYYQLNGDRFAAEIAKLNDYAKQSLSSIPKDRRVLITAHDAFN